MNGSHRALLIGVPAYRDDAIDDLPFVVDDMAELADALSDAGYHVTVHDTEETDLDGIDSAVEAFFQDAAPGETLLLYLSGHGIHHDSKDYLVPRGARTRSHDFRRRCLPLDFGGYVERSRAGDVIVFVDACREGIHLKEMAGINAAGWSDMKVARTGERRYCHVYACSPGERARYTTAGNATFSIFSRALSTVVADEAGPGTVRELKEQLQSATDELTAEHNCPRQQIRVQTETDIDEFVVFPRADRDVPGAAGEHPWVTAARAHPAWQQVGDGPDSESLRAAAVAVVAHVAGQADRDEARLTADPWRPVEFAERMSDRVGWLLSKVLNPEKLALSPAEAALMVVVPYLYVACANRSAAQALVADPENLGTADSPGPERAAYEHFFTGRPRLVRRAELSARSARADGASGIAWWLFRRWLAEQPGDTHDQVLAGLLGPVEDLLASLPAGPHRALAAELLGGDALPTLLRSLRSSFDATVVRSERQLAGGSGAEQHLRVQLLVVLLTVAHHLAIDPVLLPDVIVDHLGISYAVDLAELHTTVRTARWDPRGRTRVLNAACRHPAVGLALRQQAEAVDALLGAVDVQVGTDPRLAPLRDLPVHATADQVHAAADYRGRPVYESTDLRFRLADDRIQELLMGEQLYGDPALAIRELYQNALDACRYRGARIAYLRRRGAQLPDWQGRITFIQGVDDYGRPYIECTDNGIGMGERELREVFSHAGKRFADLPEYHDELAAWRAEGIELHPNSRFGIGVLSYFMIADDISVTTCRLDRDGHPGHRLQVDIAGPGSLFRIRDLGRGYDACTTVRLYLRPSDRPLSCTDLLRRLLWISEYAVVAEEAGTRLEWQPHVLSTVAPLGGSDPYSAEAARVEGARVDATSRPEVWWTSTHGGVLADGVWVGEGLYGAVVNLTGRYAPQLTVDRRRTLGYDRAHVAEVLHQEIPALLLEHGEVLDHGWLSELVRHRPLLADAVHEALVRSGYRPWVVNGHELDVAVVGCFPADTGLVLNDDSVMRGFVGQGVPAAIQDWRILSWAAAGVVAGATVTDPVALPVARPTDDAVLALDGSAAHASSDDRQGSVWLDPNEPVPLGHVLGTAHRLGRPPLEVVGRLAELGLRPAEGVRVPQTVDPEDLVLLSWGSDGRPPWVIDTSPVPLGHVLSVATTLGRAPRAVVQRMAEWGLRPAEGVAVPETVDPEDLFLLGVEHRQVELAWLDDAEPVPVAHLLSCAMSWGRSPAVVGARLAALGLKVPPALALPDSALPFDQTLLGLGGYAPPLEASEPVPLGHVLAVAEQLDWTPEAVVSRLAEWGLRLPEGVRVPDRVRPVDLVVLSRDLDGVGPWLDTSDPVPLPQVLVAAAELGRRPEDVAQGLAELGVCVLGDPVLPERFDPSDLVYLSKSLDGQSPWLDWGAPVSLGHIMCSADRTRRRPAEVAAFLAACGLRVPETDLPERVDRSDLDLLSRDGDGDAPWLDFQAPVSSAHVLELAVKLGRRPRDVAARCAELGIFCSDRAVTLLERMEWEDLRLVNNVGSGAAWLEKGTPLKLRHVSQFAVRSGQPLRETAERLVRLGFVLAGDIVYG
ncbi:caspase family protein [Streptomyces sp. NPDC048521]|uniref:wHTH domain-containing protein n=1 Tax=Streptomyces sp. NPDC048521 TaxID=3365566 RepID=UPI003710FC64